jgi:hypothetical protein
MFYLIVQYRNLSLYPKTNNFQCSKCYNLFANHYHHNFNITILSLTNINIVFIYNFLKPNSKLAIHTTYHLFYKYSNL